MTRLHRREQRASLRFPVQGFARVNSAGGAWRCSIENLSEGGALLRGRTPIVAGDRVRAELCVRGASVVEVDGRVARNTVDTGVADGLAIEFSRLPATAQDALHFISVTMLERADQPAVLLVGPPSPAQHAIRSALFTLGWRVVTSCTPLETVQLLHRDEICCSVVAQELEHSSGLELLAFLAQEHPKVRRILLAKDRHWRRAWQMHRVGIVDGVLFDPVSELDLKLIGRFGRRAGDSADGDTPPEPNGSRVDPAASRDATTGR